ncbi:MAG: ParA family protein [Candidatus Thiodiazotropha sp. (ex Lucinoma aequizonata)]|nr:ParA family protein [Candidatus Thiodiazotropha sp. (ex Lucinoma aequizonata)]MCU7888032.1 ParA family protein [Candidatus Thiodiazotropha sp. (ex Lucinoma aequizonata)]MCU7894387.1 ParA family protein [Candidatus Thiodiazotropha sp. (ex Lucinoma aequizonata)]MCU7899453.1 ParA family protein [Candidatus Thiodiazotropha sp. (ex Lucinoma aequizonata)]MCU7903515.1 ParA family protein [Candidatus Thiodiazotropha sp. (ex Lucinoma aequizonata)]
MTYKLAMVAQKGGVRKSTLARIIAVEATKGGLRTKMADLDTQQTTSVKWAARRANNGIEPPIRAESFRTVAQALQDAPSFDLYIFDAAPHSSMETQKACQAADIVVIPTSEGLDDLEPSVVLANNLLKEGIPAKKIAFALCITSDSEREIAGARDYLAKTPYTVLSGEIPFRSAFKISMDKGKAITETSFPTLRKRTDAMAHSIIDAVAAAADREVA